VDLSGLDFVPEVHSVLQLPILAQTQSITSPDFIVEEVIPGGMGICIRVRHQGDQREYAVKMLRLGAATPEILRRFSEEVKIWVTLSACSGVVPAYCVERVNERPVVCAKWFESGSLPRYLPRKEPAFFYRTIQRVVETLGWAWTTYKAVHRDMKPDNILFDPNRWPFVADFGIARIFYESVVDEHKSKQPLNRAADLRLTAAGQFLGTALYAAPEQLLDTASADLRSDIYSLGCVMFEWETGVPPFCGNSAAEIAMAHLRQKPPRIGGWMKGSSFGANKVLLKCLEKRPENRFQNYEELSAALSEAARKRHISWTRLPVSKPAAGHVVGRGEIKELFTAGRPVKDGAIVDYASADPYLRDAEALIGLGEWQKAADLLRPFFIPEMAREIPDVPFVQAIANCYAACLTSLGRAEEAVQVFRLLEPASEKSASFFVNFSNALNHVHRYSEAEAIARQGLKSFPTDHDILGNLTISLLYQRRFGEALDNARRRLQMGRDIHALEELAVVLASLGKRDADADWPHAVSYYREAIGLLEEAKRLNPNHAASLYNLADCWYQLDEHKRCMNEIIPLFKLNPHRGLLELVITLSARCQLSNSLCRECVKFVDKWLLKFPDWGQLKRVRAEAIVDGFVIGNFKNGARFVDKPSLEYFEAIVNDADRRTASDFCFLARLKHWIGENSAAFRVLDEAQRVFPESYDVAFCQANLRLQAGDVNHALPCARKAAKLGKWHAPAWELLATISTNLGQTTEAAEAQRMAAEIRVERSRLSDAGAQMQSDDSLGFERGSKQAAISAQSALNILFDPEH
jgi:serine/threonine protein kinase/Flp pilus assembly protein TadD